MNADNFDNLSAGVIRIVSDILRIESISVEDDLKKMGLESLDALEILALLEKEFDIELTEDVIVEFQTISRITKVLRGVISPSKGKLTS